MSPLGRTVVLKVVTNNRGIVARGIRIGSASSIAAGRAIVVWRHIVRSVIVRRNSNSGSTAGASLSRASASSGSAASSAEFFAPSLSASLSGSASASSVTGFPDSICAHANAMTAEHSTTSMPGLVRLPMPKIPRITNFASKTPTIANAANPDEAKSKRFAS